MFPFEAIKNFMSQNNIVFSQKKLTKTAYNFTQKLIV